MLVANSFDLWQKDTFFSAAEEVQRSADIMESAYRTWEREKIARLNPIYLDELCRELQTALGTAKWQLEEFGKAVAQSYRIREDDITMARHKQFFDAIENQISRVETSLQNYFNKEGKKPLRWVNLDEEESDDLAAFLSGTKQIARKTCDNREASTNLSLEKNNAVEMEKGISYHGKDIDFHEKRENNECENDRTSGSRTTWSSSNRGEWKILIDPEENQNNYLAPNYLAPNIEVTPKNKGRKDVFWRERPRERFEVKRGISSYSQSRRSRWINQILGRAGGCRRQLQGPNLLKLSSLKLSSLKFKLILMLSLFLIVPFLIYS